MDATITFKPHTHLPLRTLSQPPKDLLLQSLINLVTLSPPEIAALGPRKGFYQGPLSIAYLFFHLSHSHPTLLVQGKTPSQWFTSYLLPPPPASKPEDENEDDTHHPPHTGITHESLCYLALLAASTQDASSFLLAMTATRLPPIQDFLLGTAGLLSLLRFVSTFVPSSTPAVSPLVSRLLTHVTSSPWDLSSRIFTGAVHGSAGILTQVCLSGGASLVESAVVELLDLQLGDGNWYATTDRKHEYMQWCHGGAGILISLLAVEKFFEGEVRARIRRAVEKGRELVFEKGVLRKEPCLCHGVVGNALAVEDRERREHLLSFAERGMGGEEGGEEGDGEWEMSEDKVGLFCGEAGRAWVWAMMDGGREGFPTYTDV